MANEFGRLGISHELNRLSLMMEGVEEIARYLGEKKEISDEEVKKFEYDSLCVRVDLLRIANNTYDGPSEHKPYEEITCSD